MGRQPTQPLQNKSLFTVFRVMFGWVLGISMGQVATSLGFNMPLTLLFVVIVYVGIFYLLELLYNRAEKKYKRYIMCVPLALILIVFVIAPILKRL